MLLVVSPSPAGVKQIEIKNTQIMMHPGSGGVCGFGLLLPQDDSSLSLSLVEREKK